MTREITFTVAGVPIDALPSPSKEHEALRAAWRQQVVLEAIKHRVTFVKQSPLRLRLVFQFPRPKSARTDWAPTGPRVTRLADEVVDALVAGRVLIDAAQVVRIVVAKRYGEPGVAITVTDVHNSERAAA